MKCELVGLLEMMTEKPMPGFSRAIELSGKVSTDEREILRPEVFIVPCSNHFKEHILKVSKTEGGKFFLPKIKITIETIE